MNPDQLEKLRIERPFRAFTIHVSDGSQYPIPSSEYIQRTKSGRTISVLAQDGETFEIIDMIHVTKITTGEPTELAPEEPRRRSV